MRKSRVTVSRKSSSSSTTKMEAPMPVLPVKSRCRGRYLGLRFISSSKSSLSSLSKSPINTIE